MNRLYVESDFDVPAKPTLMKEMHGVGNVLENIVFNNIATKPDLRIEMDIRHVENRAGDGVKVLMDGYYGKSSEEDLHKVDDYVVVCPKAYDSSKGVYIDTDSIYVVNFSTYCSTDTVQIRKDIKEWICQRFLDSLYYVCIADPKGYPGIDETLHAWDY